MAAEENRSEIIFPMISSRRPNRKVRIEIKDIFVALPLAGSAMAISWEIGSFIPIGPGTFGLFSLSEHLLFAMQALPIALVIAAFLSLIVVGVRNRRRRIAWFNSGSSKVRRGIAGGAFMLFMLAALLLYLAKDARSLSVAVLAIGTASAGFVLCRYPPAFVLWPKLLTVPFVAFVLAFSVALGSDQMRGALNYANLVSARDADLIRLSVDGNMKYVYLIRSGERGILVYEKASSKFHFIKWDATKSLEWSRHPMFRTVAPDSKP